MPEPRIIGSAPALRRARDLAQRFALSALPILLLGETGTGKELFAQLVHLRSGRGGPLVDLNCGALPRELVESLLFGHVKGAFTGAVDGGPGLIEAAAGGTLFLDEVSSLPLEAQAKLLRVLESKEVRRVGEVVSRPVDFRVVAAAGPGLGAMVAQGTFRADLYHRLNGATICLPPLRDRGNDVEDVASDILAPFGCSLEAAATRALREHTWPGNIRELRLTLERAVFLSDGPTLTAGILAEAMALAIAPPGDTAGPGPGADTYLSPEILLELTRRCQGNASEMAAALGIGRTKLFAHLRRAGISLRTERYRANR